MLFTLQTYSFSFFSLKTELNRGLFPNVFNLAAGSIITANATCGEGKPEFYCPIIAQGGQESCNVCDSLNVDKSKHHTIKYAIDGLDTWWQSPTLQNGKRYEWVTIQINLRQVYQISYVVIKSAISPLPANWILERSVDGANWAPWQYFARTDTECWERYHVRPTIGKIRFRTDDEVICTSIYSKNDTLENGEAYISLLNGRPGIDGPEGMSSTLRDFTRAQYVRLRLQKVRTLNGNVLYDDQDLDKSDKSLTRRVSGIINF